MKSSLFKRFLVACFVLAASGAATLAAETAGEGVPGAIQHASAQGIDYIPTLFVFVLATFVGLDVIRRVSRLLHTPLMSLTNAISAIAVVGSILIAGQQHAQYKFNHSGAGCHRGFRQQHRQRLFNYRPNVEDVQKTRGQQIMNTWIQIAYLISTALFIFSLKWMNDPQTARRGVIAGVAAMLVAVIGTLINPAIMASNYKWIALAVVIGSVIGVPLSWVPLTAVPQRTALSHSFGGLAAGLVGVSEFYLSFTEPGLELSHFRVAALCAEVLLGFLTFTGSLMAAGKLQEIVPTRPITYKGQNIINLGLFAVAIICCVVLTIDANYKFVFPLIILLALLFGVLLIMPIGGADMPTVISMLNSYAGLSAVAMGFVMDNKLLITAGALDGSSGLILSIIMCKAMNRSFANVLFGAFGRVQAAAADATKKTVKSATPQDAAQIMEQAGTVVIVPGYGMAVAQAQHRCARAL